MSWRSVTEFVGLPWRDFAREASGVAFIFAKFFCFMHVASNYVCSTVMPVGPSMLPTYNLSGDIVLMERLSTRFGNIKRGDLVVFRSPQNPRKIVCKRVTGVEGDCVEFCRTENGEENRSVVVPKGHVWVQGDNLSVSKDSRIFGPLSCSLLQGKVFWRIWPIEGFGVLS
uniref:Peptidase S26 domain-containing protein n=1 Tax=Araucaria cunninghamii TaxID=56994 RepID=A0A0D6R890_ARACU